MIESLQLALAKTCLRGAASLFASLSGDDAEQPGVWTRDGGTKELTLPVYASDSSGANRIQLSDFALSTSPSSPVDSRTFYMACGKIGSGSVFASCALENGGTLTDSATYRVIEPIFRLVNNEIDSSYRRYVNPSRLVVGEPSTFRVGVGVLYIHGSDSEVYSQ